MNEDNEMSVFKSYLRGLLRRLKELQEILDEKDYEKARKLVAEMIEDTQKGLED